MTEKIKTIVYIDGYNLYYSCLKDTSFKWLDIPKLFERILKDQNPAIEIIKIKYFTAPALGRFASNGSKSAEAQQTYHRALQYCYPDLMEIIFGNHTQVKKPLPRYDENIPFCKQDRHWVWVLEEKLTDVQLAIAMYRDAAQLKCDQLVICSNDSDMTPALKAIREDLPDFKIGIVMPIRQSLQSRRASKSLEMLSTWTRHCIRDEELENSQLPEKVPTNKKPMLKPLHWSKGEITPLQTNGTQE
jgi:uncharacterized LabA/DUF88 family protein